METSFIVQNFVPLMFAGLWGVPFLVTHYGYSTAEAATLASVLLISWSAASIVWGTLSHRIGRRRTPPRR